MSLRQEPQSSIVPHRPEVKTPTLPTRPRPPLHIQSEPVLHATTLRPDARVPGLPTRPAPPRHAPSNPVYQPPPILPVGDEKIQSRRSELFADAKKLAGKRWVRKGARVFGTIALATVVGGAASDIVDGFSGVFDSSGGGSGTGDFGAGDAGGFTTDNAGFGTAYSGGGFDNGSFANTDTGGFDSGAPVDNSGAGSAMSSSVQQGLDTTSWMQNQYWQNVTLPQSAASAPFAPAANPAMLHVG